MYINFTPGQEVDGCERFSLIGNKKKCVKIKSHSSMGRVKSGEYKKETLADQILNEKQVVLWE